jgi:hypothetical protein
MIRARHAAAAPSSATGWSRAAVRSAATGFAREARCPAAPRRRGGDRDRGRASHRRAGLRDGHRGHGDASPRQARARTSGVPAPPRPLGSVTSTLPVAGPTVDPQRRRVIAAACRDVVCLRVRYRSRYMAPTAGARSSRTRSSTHGHRWYHGRVGSPPDDRRTFRVDRLATPASTGVRFTPRPLPAEDAAAYLEQMARAAHRDARRRLRPARTARAGRAATDAGVPAQARQSLSQPVPSAIAAGLGRAACAAGLTRPTLRHGPQRQPSATAVPCRCAERFPRRGIHWRPGL